MRILSAIIPVALALALAACGPPDGPLLLDAAGSDADIAVVDVADMSAAEAEVRHEVIDAPGSVEVLADTVEIQPVEVVEVADQEVGEIIPVMILSPEDGETVNLGDTVHFEGVVDDANDEPAQLSVEWLSDLDGKLLEGVPDDEGVTEFDKSDLSGGAHAITLRVTNQKGLAQVANIEIFVNSPPSTPLVTLQPEEPGTLNDLTAVLEGEALDPDGDEVDVEISWFKEGNQVEELGGLVEAGFELTAKGETWSVVVKSYDGFMYGSVSQDKVQIMNTLPSLEKVVLEPAEGYADTEFNCSAEGWNDPDGAEEAYKTGWTISGWPLDEETTATLGPDKSKKGDVVVCVVTPCDEEGEGIPVESNAAVVMNSPPEGGTALLLPAEGNTATEFECTAEGADDPDGDGIDYEYSWMVNGEKLPGVDSNSISGSLLAKGDTFLCRVVPTDGTDSGIPFDSNAVVLGNSPPTVASAELVPEGATGASTLTCLAIDPADSDGDPVTVKTEWYVNGELLQGENTETLSFEHFVKWDEVTCKLTPNDGEVDGESVSPEAPLVIANALPTLTSAQLTPEEGNELLLFACTAQGWFDADDELFEVTYKWEVNGETVEDVSDGLLSGMHYDKGDEVVCYAIPKNGDELGEPVQSNPGLVVNAPPYVASALVEPPAGPMTTIFNCSYEGLGDADPVDLPYAEYQWLANGEDLDGETEETIQGATAGKGASLSCRVTPFDEEGAGPPVESQPVMVVNTTPTLLAVSVEPPEGNMNTEFQCVPFGWLDPDGDLPNYEFRWFVDDEEVVGATGEFLTGVVLWPGKQITCEATPMDDQGKGVPVMSPIATVINHPPTVAQVSQGPIPASTFSTLTCGPFGWADEDGDEEKYLYEWYVDENKVDGADQPTLTGENFGSDQKVYCVVIPYDGFAQGMPVKSNSVTIGNTPPALATVVVEPAEGDVLSEFSCVPGGWGDIDDDPEGYLFEWLVHGEIMEGEDQETVSGAGMKKGDSVVCKVTPFDGKDYGSPLTSDPVILSNALPQASAAALSPDEVFTDTVLTCVASGWDDPDMDQEDYHYSWLVDGVEVDGEATATLDGSHFDKGAQVICLAIPFDGTDEGPPVESQAATILNSPPVLDGAAVEPGSGGRLDEFTCTTGDTTDADGDGVSLKYQWLTDGVEVPGATEQKYTPKDAAPGEKLSCAATPCDQQQCGGAVDAAPADIVNKVPSIDKVEVVPAAPCTDDELTCQPTGWLDEDNDAEQYDFAWFVDGVETQGQTAQTLAPEFSVKHQQIHCVATPDDGFDKGEPQVAIPVEVLNSPPVLSPVGITPDSGTKVTTFTCVAGDTSDKDDDPVDLKYEWLADGNVIENLVTETYKPVDQAAGTTIACRVTPYDDEGAGQTQKGPDVVLGNTPPVVAKVVLTPETAYTDSTLICTANGVDDLESDPVSLKYGWFLDDAELIGKTESTLTGDHFSKHEKVHCSITPDDGIEEGDSVDSNGVTIQNTVPTTPTVSVAPAQPETEDDLICQIDAESTDKDGDPLDYAYQWYMDDVLQENFESAAVSQNDTMECQTWRCVATPGDGEEDGKPGEGEQTVKAGDEACDGHDNNCNGEVDEGFDVLLLPCDGLKKVTRRIPITVNGSAGWQLTDFQVKIQVPYQANMQPDFVDVRFTGADGETLLPHWKESYVSSTSAVFWIKVPTVPAQPGTTTLYLYYGNPLSQSRSDIHETFLFGDDFEDADWTNSHWQSILGSWSVTGGVYKGTGDDAVIRNSEVIPEESRVMEGRMKTVVPGPEHAWDMGWMHVKYKNESNDVYAAIYHDGSGYSTGDVGVSVEYNGGFVVYDTKSQATPAINPASWNDIKIVVNGINARLWVNGQLYIDANNSQIANLVATHIGLAAHDCTAHYDNIRVRKYAPAEPPSSFGSVQEICVPVCK